eukprot:815555-Rhodomonas_salina.4
MPLNVQREVAYVPHLPLKSPTSLLAALAQVTRRSRAILLLSQPQSLKSERYIAFGACPEMHRVCCYTMRGTGMRHCYVRAMPCPVLT